nr:acetyl-coenzyme a synthetase (ACSA) [Polytomella parva]|eukprot:CAMPEP_0175050610 /NCGR_PEP_ID=MMETSP0052_2-20121109/7350_1 /TAXON_ID=51329 ORGANISM="Polytomella parva, Strain SAG 63-3" /NCGR_SAMPLE_ID=MMETSP0052_2 /ASSEMBLY_ACC=CAM_ASM_000194 /LENGTH=702 /DNA_ID=CAMNT_0016314823 /DNA_START=99 /DNA_END=2207 /DNA_ORIENTATION=+
MLQAHHNVASQALASKRTTKAFVSSGSVKRSSARIVSVKAVKVAAPRLKPLTEPGTFIENRQQYDALYKRSIEDSEGFWSDIARDFYWEKEWDKNHVKANMDVTKGKVNVEWFRGGRTNVCYNALDRHVEAGHGNVPCILWEGNDIDHSHTYTYAEALTEVCKLANWLRSQGVRKGDTVAIYLPMFAELPFAMLACARIGAIHSVIFGGFSSESLADRIQNCKAKVLLTANGVLRGAKKIALKPIVDKALKIASNPSNPDSHSVQSVLVYANANAYSRAETPMNGSKDLWWQDEVAKMSPVCPVEWVESEHPLFLLYTSGSTGKPKGVVHTTGGYMVYAATTTKYVFRLQRGDVYWCTADCGWITGHSYVTYGPMLLGATQVVFEGVPTYPTPARCWQVVDKYQVKQFYTAPTAIRSLMSFGDKFVTDHSRKSLRVLGSVGEPINPEAWRWFHDVVGNGQCPIADTWWQTESGGHMIVPLPHAWPEKPGSATLPFFGVEPVILDEKGCEVKETEAQGILAIKKPWPAVVRGVHGDHDRYESNYFGPFPGYYFTGDGARRDADGYIWITGRVDDVINVSGHRIGTAEVESALVAHPQCAEAAVVAYDHPIKGQGIYAYVTLMEGTQPSAKLKKELANQVRSMIGAFAAPDVIHWAPGLPKTRSGKIMRRVLRKIASKEESQLGDISTLADPHVVQHLIENRGK